MSELKIKLGVDLSEVDAAASEIPDKIERQARRQRRPTMRPLRVWDEIAGKWVPATNQQNPQVPGGPSNRGAPTPSAYSQQIGPGLPGMPGGLPLPAAVASRQYNRPIGPGMAGMPGGALSTTWADTFRDKLTDALEKSMLRMVVPVHLFNRFTNYIIGGIAESFERASRVAVASRASGLNAEQVQRLAYAAKMAGANVDDLYSVLEQGNVKIGNMILKGGDSAVALSRLGITVSDLRNRSQNTSTILLKLAEMYEDVNQRALVASIGFSIFGDQFNKMIPLISRGRKEIEGFMQEAVVMSEAEVRTMENAKRKWGQLTDIAQVAIASTFDMITGESRRMRDEVQRNVAGLLGYKPSIGNISYIGDIDKFSKMSTREKLEVMYGLSPDRGPLLKGEKPRSPWGTRQPGESASSWQNRIDAMFKEMLNEVSDPKARAEIESMMKELPGFIIDKTKQGNLLSSSLPMATSLQAMGGGDILSALQRNPMEDIARNTAETAANTAIMAGQANGNNQPQPQPIVGP